MMKMEVPPTASVPADRATTAGLLDEEAPHQPMAPGDIVTDAAPAPPATAIPTMDRSAVSGARPIRVVRVCW